MEENVLMVSINQPILKVIKTGQQSHSIKITPKAMRIHNTTLLHAAAVDLASTVPDLDRVSPPQNHQSPIERLL